MPPLWSLGYQQCRFSYESEERVRGIAKLLRDHRIPCDTIYFDIDYMDGFRCFTWDSKRFKDPSGLLKDLAKDGFKTVNIVDPAIKVDPNYTVYQQGLAGKHFCLGPNGKTYVGKVWPGEAAYPDFTNPKTRAWWGDQYQGFVKDGVRGFWNDMNEPSDFTQPDHLVPNTLRHNGDGHPAEHRDLHNIYGMQMARATYEGLRKLRPDERPFVLTRAGFSGIQRYAAVWTGDNASEWEHLRMSVPMLLNMSLSGLNFIGADIGGFRETCTAELYTRWIQLGVFYPLCRTHTGGGAEQDPCAYGEKYEKINRAAIELRYRLLPYIYTQFKHAADTGIPLMRPLLLDYPSMKNVFNIEYEFKFGPDLYVAPVLRPDAKKRKFHLPPGDWYNFFTGAKHEGDADLDVDVDLSSMPLYARAGSVIPMQELVQFIDEKPLKELILAVFPGNGQSTYYADDGVSYEFEKGSFTREDYDVTDSKDKCIVTLTSREGIAKFSPQSYVIEFHGCEKKPADISINDEGIKGWTYDADRHTATVRLKQLAPKDRLTLRR